MNNNFTNKSSIIGKPRIFIIETVASFLDMYKAKLEAEGFQVVAFTNVDEKIISEIAKFKPNLILLDTMSPKDDSDISRLLKKNAITKEFVVITLTELVNKEVEVYKRKGISQGGIDFHIKMVHSPSYLVEKIKEILISQDEKIKHKSDNNLLTKSFTIEQIFRLLINNIKKPPDDFFNYCKNVGMKRIECIKDKGQYYLMPPFDERRCYTFNSPRTKNVIFEILINSGLTLQGGVNLFYEKDNSAKAKEIFDIGKKLLDDYFGLGISEGTPKDPLYNYGDNELLGYISVTSYDYIGINLKIGNAKIWNKYYPIK